MKMLRISRASGSKILKSYWTKSTTISSTVLKIYQEKSAGGRASKWWKNNNAWLSHVREGKRWFGMDKVIHPKYVKHLKEAAQKCI